MAGLVPAIHAQEPGNADGLSGAIGRAAALCHAAIASHIRRHGEDIGERSDAVLDGFPGHDGRRVLEQQR